MFRMLPLELKHTKQANPYSDKWKQ